MVRLSAIQLTSVTNVEDNLTTIRRIIACLPVATEHLVVLPECCLYFGSKDDQQLTLAKETAENQQLVGVLSQIAQDFNITLVAGTIPVLTAAKTKFYNRSCVFSPDGSMLGCYDKIHLFDTLFQNKQKKDEVNNYCESQYTEAGDKAQIITTPFAKLGLSVCYDLRFPELYRYLTGQGAEIITLPSAFTKVTGKAHWQTLLQARAIENQVYIVASGQTGIHKNGRETWGHSMIINPWGDILACHEQGEGVVSAEFSREKLLSVRASMPVADHNQYIVKLKVKNE